MRNRAIVPLIMLLAATATRAEGIRYDRIPSDVTGYALVDIDRFISSQLCKQINGVLGTQTSQLNAMFGEHADVTMYVSKSGGPGGFVLLWHTSDRQLHRRFMTAFAGDENAVVFTYGAQEIHFASPSLTQLWSGVPRTTRPAKNATAAKKTEPSGKTSVFSIGLGNGQMNLNNGPSYAAFVGPDLIVLAGDVPSMAGALDVVQGKKPSLATRDPQNLKWDAPPGVFIEGVGLTANFLRDSANKRENGSTDPASAATQPAKPAEFGGGNFGLDLYGSLKANAQLARFDIGEDEQNLYGDASFTMVDSDSAGQLKNLVMGVKALIYLTQLDQKPLLDPLEVSSSEKTVVLHWSWPAAKIPELIRLTEAHGDREHPLPATAPLAPSQH